MRCAVIGAGVIGLATARVMAQAGHQVDIYEQHHDIGLEVSSHNSEIIHAGIYYISGSKKAKLAVRGAEMLYAYCAEKQIAHRRCGKLIIATDESQHAKLDALQVKAEANGVHGIIRLNAAEFKARVQKVTGTAAIFSPNTGIVSVKQLMAAMLQDACSASANLYLGHTVIAMGQTHSHLWLRTQLDTTHQEYDYIVNAAGLGASKVLQSFEGFPVAAWQPTYFAKGNYFRLNRRFDCPHLLYPLPEPGGLGIHLTFDFAGQCRFGPDVEWVAAPDYQVNPTRRAHFHNEITRYLPWVKEDDLSPFFAGVRPKIVPQGAPDADFVIQNSAEHGISGLINLLGFESPGLTSCLAIGQQVKDLYFSN